MTDNDDRGSDDLVTRWVAAWAHVRDCPVRTVDGWPMVVLNGITRDRELVCVDPGAESLLRLVPRVAGDARAMLTVLADDLAPYRRLALPSDVRVDRDDETLMTTSLALTAVPPLPEGFVARWDVVGPRVTYVVECGERVAAEGTIGVLGTDAVVDAVETTPRFRRQGLARHVMATVQVAAVERGATHGILAATVDGRRLYESLGWRARMPMWSLMGVGPAGTS